MRQLALSEGHPAGTRLLPPPPHTEWPAPCLHCHRRDDCRPGNGPRLQHGGDARAVAQAEQHLGPQPMQVCLDAVKAGDVGVANQLGGQREAPAACVDWVGWGGWERGRGRRLCLPFGCSVGLAHSPLAVATASITVFTVAFCHRPACAKPRRLRRRSRAGDRAQGAGGQPHQPCSAAGASTHSQSASALGGDAVTRWYSVLPSELFLLHIAGWRGVRFQGSGGAQRTLCARGHQPGQWQRKVAAGAGCSVGSCGGQHHRQQQHLVGVAVAKGPHLGTRRHGGGGRAVTKRRCARAGCPAAAAGDARPRLRLRLPRGTRRTFHAHSPTWSSLWGGAARARPIRAGRP